MHAGFSLDLMPSINSCVDFLQRLIQTPSMPGEEKAIAELVSSEMKKLRYDDVYIDDAGNVIGRLIGRGEAPAVMFNTHLDHVDIGDENAWPYPPFGGEIHDGSIWGRGAVDIKGPLAAQVYGIATLKEDGSLPPGDVFVTAVVYEEIGGVGARHLATQLTVPYVIIGEPSNNQLRRGHRGRIELVLHIRGKSVHASVPHRGINPLEVAARFISRLKDLEMTSDPDLGPSSVAPTLFITDQKSTNVIPGEVWLTLDWRNVPGEYEAEVLKKLQPLIEESLIEGAVAELSVPSRPRRCYTGFTMDISACNDPFVTRMNAPAAIAALSVLETALGSAPVMDFWRFATDGGHFARAGSTCIGFGPGDEMLAHTVNEHIPISQLKSALIGNEALARRWSSEIEAAAR